MAAADQSPLQVTQGALWPSSLRAPMPEVKPVVTHPVAARPATTVEERLRESAVREARRWNLCATQGDVSCLEERRKDIELALRNAVQEVRKFEKRSRRRRSCRKSRTRDCGESLGHSRSRKVSFAPPITNSMRRTFRFTR